MDFTNILEVLPTLTDCQIKVIYDHIGEIQREREEEKRKILINDFKKAFSALREAGIYITIECEGEDYYDNVYINDANQFEFS